MSTIIQESLSNWNTKYWIHYSDVNYIKVHDKPSHNDPTGIYFFPLNIGLTSMIKHHWNKKRYKIIVSIKLKNLNIFDVSIQSMDNLADFLKNIGVSNGKKMLSNYDWIFDTDSVLKFGFHTDKTPVSQNRIPTYHELFWEILRLKSKRNGAVLTTYFQTNGYDGIFDDVGIICPKEYQLVLFDDQNIKIKKIIGNNKL